MNVSSTFKYDPLQRTFVVVKESHKESVRRPPEHIRRNVLEQRTQGSPVPLSLAPGGLQVDRVVSAVLQPAGASGSRLGIWPTA
jgi:hypothetical protein